jgi:hypothetical protein
MGANPDLLNRLNGNSLSAYAFFGGPPLSRQEVVQASGPVAGHARMRPDGFFGPATRSTGTKNSLYDAIMRAPIPWPYTPGGGPAGTDYTRAAAAIKYISNCLPDLSDWDDIRLAYFGQEDANWNTARSNLGHIYYPGKAPSRQQDPDQLHCLSPSPLNFSQDLFDHIHGQLFTEFGNLASLKTMFGVVEKGFWTSGEGSQPFLSSLGSTIQGQVKAPDTGITSPILYLLGSIAEVAEESAPGVGAALNLAADAFDLGSAASSIGSGDGTDPVPVAQRISDTVDKLAGDIQTRMATAANVLDQIRLVGGSDWGRMQALMDIQNATPGLNQTALSDELQTGAKAYFASTLLPVAFDVWGLKPGTQGPNDPYPRKTIRRRRTAIHRPATTSITSPTPPARRTTRGYPSDIRTPRRA